MDLRFVFRFRFEYCKSLIVRRGSMRSNYCLLVLLLAGSLLMLLADQTRCQKRPADSTIGVAGKIGITGIIATSSLAKVAARAGHELTYRAEPRQV